MEKMTAEQEWKTHKKAEIESFQERKNKTKTKKRNILESIFQVVLYRHSSNVNDKTL